VSLSSEIGDFGSLVGLLLALATLLTANRASVLAKLDEASDLDRHDKWREVILNAGLATITTLVFLAGLPLAIRAAGGLHPLAHGGPLRSVFVLAWALLIALVGWQVRLAVAAAQLKLPG